MADGPSSYTNTRLGLFLRLSEAKSLFRRYTSDLGQDVSGLLQQMDYARAAIESALGSALKAKKILEIGPGQQLRQARYFAADNDVIAIDLDEIVFGANPLVLLRALKVNGPIRFLKTMARKIAGFDRRFVKEMIRQRPPIADARPRVFRRDATNTELPSASIDCAMSYSVFEHFPDPDAVLREIVRVLSPGGVSHHVVHIYSSDSGAHDARTFVGNRELPFWCHLQPDQAHLVASNCYVNKLSLADWLSLFERYCPGARVEYFRSEDAVSIKALSDLRDRGLLANYSDAELLTNAVQFTWKKH